jgi:hypothetical protein
MRKFMARHSQYCDAFNLLLETSLADIVDTNENEIDERKVKKGKKSRAGSMNLMLVGGAAGLVGIFSAVGLVLLMGNRK